MARFTVQMTLEAPGRRGQVRAGGIGRVHYLAGDGVIAVTATVRADSATEAAEQVRRSVEREHAPVRVLSWTATRVVPVLAGLRRGRSRVVGGPQSWGEGWDEGGGTAGVREPRRPKPSPGSLSAAAEPPEDRFPT